MKKILKITLILSGIVLSKSGFAQCDSTASHMQQHLGTKYISDGQLYRAFLNGEEVAEFHVTFFGGNKYRIAGGNGVTDGNLVFTLYDTEGNLLFTNNDYKNTPYWDFEFKSTVDCVVEAQLASLTGASGCAVLLIGFER